MYSLGKSMVYLLGGNIKTNELPKSVDKRIKDFLMKFLHINPIERTRDAWKSWHELSNLREKVFGTRHQFLEFIVD
jgi:hypothetical protein